MNETITSIQIVDDLVNIVRRVMNIELKVNFSSMIELFLFLNPIPLATTIISLFEFIVLAYFNIFLIIHIFIL